MRRAVSETIHVLRPALCCGQNSLHARVSHKLAHALKWATNWLKFGSEAASANEKCPSDRCALGRGGCGSLASPLFLQKTATTHAILCPVDFTTTAVEHGGVFGTRATLGVQRSGDLLTAWHRELSEDNWLSRCAVV